MGCSWKWVVLWSLWAARLVRQPTQPLRVSGGLLRGSVAHDGSHRNYLAIPYATVTREHRFQAPQPLPHWEGVLDAYNENIRCSQRYLLGMVAGREDCLILNVYTPLQKSTAPRPVMVFIHGGGFREGSGSRFLYGPEHLVKHDIILVTINYRLEILGFLCLGTEGAPGNAGMKDQVEALKWVKRNIRAFGGDPDNVTIFGESAGAAAVLYHMVSPMSRGLFNRAILQSGSIAPWSFQYEPLKAASALAKRMGYNTVDPKEIHQIFKSKTAEKLLTTRVPRVEGDIVLSENIFVPCVEKKLSGIEPFLLDTPFNLLLKGLYSKVPIIIGFNNAEGLMFLGKENDTTIAKMNTYKALPRDLAFTTEEDKIETAVKLQEHYMGDEKVSKETLLKFSKFVGDSCITYPVIATVDIILKTSKEAIYAYKLSYDGWMNLAKLYFGFSRTPGATHADELFYMFKPAITLVQSFFETEMVEKITTMWTNFAKTGNPTPTRTSIEWKAVDERDPKLLVIDKEFSFSPMWNEEAIKFWNTTYAKFRRKL